MAHQAAIDLWHIETEFLYRKRLVEALCKQGDSSNKYNREAKDALSDASSNVKKLDSHLGKLRDRGFKRHHMRNLLWFAFQYSDFIVEMRKDFTRLSVQVDFAERLAKIPYAI